MNLVIYYSFEGSTKFIAETIAQGISADILELKPEKELKSHGFSKYIWGGRQVVMKTKPKLLSYDKNPNDYNLIFIGTPVWAFTFAPPLRTFFSQVKLQNKNIAIFCCSDGGRGKTFENMKQQLPDNNFFGEMEFVRTSKNREENRKKAIEWVKELKLFS